MSGERDLLTLIKKMKPQLQLGDYVFCSLPANQIPMEIEPICVFREAEGVTLILLKEQADRHSIPYAFVAAWITLTVHSSLEAIGLTAAVAQQLTQAGISCNVIAAYYHDHLFVGVQDAARAMEVLTAMALRA